MRGDGAPPALRADVLAAFAIATGLSATFVVLALPLLGTMVHDFDEPWLMLDARFILGGARPFVDFPHHEMPLHLYLLAAFGKVFGPTIFGFRLLSLASVALGGLVLFALIRPFLGPIPALLGQAVFLFSPVQSHALAAVPETPMVFFTLLGALLLFASRTQWSAYASGIAFVAALLVKPTCLPVVVAAALALAWGREWSRLRALTVAGIVASILGLGWAVYVSDGIFADILRFHLSRIATRNVGMWSIDSGFTDLRRAAGIETPWQLAVSTFMEFFNAADERLPLSLFVVSLLGVPLWMMACARSRPALAAFAVLWPASYLFLNFVAVDFVSMRYFVPFPAFSAFLLAGWAWLAQRYLPTVAVATAVALVAVLLAGTVRPGLARNIDPWYLRRLHSVAQETPTVVSFSSILFAATNAEPGCGFANAALTYGGFGEAWLVTERTRGFRFSDKRLVACLKAHPDVPVVVDWAFYFFTRPGSSLRQYLAGEGLRQRLFFSPEARQQWDQPALRMSPLR